MIKAHEIQGVIALENSFNRVGLDHVILVRIASTAVVTHMLGGTKEQVDQRRFERLDRRRRAAHLPPRAEHRLAQELGRRRRHEPRRATRADRAERRDGLPVGADGADLGFLRRAVQGQAVDVSAGATAATSWKTSCSRSRSPRSSTRRPRSSARCSCTRQCDDRLDQIEQVVIETQESGVRIIDKTGPLANPADRDHCIQYMVAIPLIFGRLTAADYEDAVANDPRVDALRDKMEVRENTTFTAEYLAADKRYIGNAVQVFFKDGSSTRARARRRPDRPPQASRRRHSGAREEVRGERRRALLAVADRAGSRRCSRTERSSRRCPCTSSCRRW